MNEWWILLGLNGRVIYPCRPWRCSGWHCLPDWLMNWLTIRSVNIVHNLLGWTEGMLCALFHFWACVWGLGIHCKMLKCWIFGLNSVCLLEKCIELNCWNEWLRCWETNWNALSDWTQPWDDGHAHRVLLQRGKQDCLCSLSLSVWFYNWMCSAISFMLFL